MADKSAEKSLDLPKDFRPLADFLKNKLKLMSFVNIIGVVQDFRRPFSTRGDHWKCQLRIFDMSLEDPGDSVEIHLFRSKDEMPQEVDAGDVVVMYRAKVQKNKEADPLSVVSNFASAVHIYPATKIPKPPQPASHPSTPSPQDSKAKPYPQVEHYVSWLHHNIDKERIPDPETYKLQSIQSLNVKDKFCQLKDVTHESFHNLIVQVVQEPFDHGDKVRLYVSDYTENPCFFNYAWNGQEGFKHGDPYGYTSGKTRKANASTDWNGPFGKRTMQMTCYHPHASVIRETVRLGTWVNLLNVQIKYGTNGCNLEGYLRGDQNASSHKVQVDVMDPHEDLESIDPRLKDAIRNKLNYEKEKKAQLKQIKSTVETSKKRPAVDQPEGKRLNSKQKRALQRAQAEQKAKQHEKSEEYEEPPPDLNPQIVCENPDRPVVRVSGIIEPVAYESTIQGGPLTIKLPFTCSQYRTYVRVIDFHPPKLHDFACSRKQTEYDVLSDISDCSSESDSDHETRDTLDNFVRDERIWEWRFALCLQDAAADKEPKEQNSRGSNSNSFWVLVGNPEAELLTGLTACDLRANSGELAKLRENMFLLWGDLEEKKAKQLAETNNNKKKTKEAKKALDERPSLDSSDNEAASKSATEGAKQVISNRPFTCCIRQYGIKVSEPNAAKANAGNGKRWERVFGLFGTKIKSV